MRATSTRTALVALGAALTVILAACSDDPADTSSPAGQSSASIAATVNGISTSHNEADTTFINEMTPHHTGALEMAQLAPTRASNPKVQDLAARIAAAQGPEIDRMKAMAETWKVKLAATGGAHGGSHGGGGMGMDDASALKPLSGPAFDTEFLTRMIRHHEGALPMARAQLDAGTNPQAKALAQSIIETQTSEIAEMKALLQ